MPRNATPACPAVESPTGNAPATPRILFPVILGVVLFFGNVAPSLAASPPAFDACSGSSDIPVCQRLDYIAGQSVTIDDIYKGIGWGLGLLIVLIVLPIFMRIFSRAGVS